MSRTFGPEVSMAVYAFPRQFKKALKSVSPLNRDEMLRRSMHLMGALAFAVKDENGAQISNCVSNIIHFYVSNARSVMKMAPDENSAKVFAPNAEESVVTEATT